MPAGRKLSLICPSLRVLEMGAPAMTKLVLSVMVMAVIVMTVTVMGCTVDQPLRAPAEAPPSFDNQAGHETAWPSKQWYRGFSSAQLDRLMEQATTGNWDLVAARARIAQADARARQAGAAMFPSVAAGGNAGLLAGRSGSGSGHETDWSALLSASYEVDFWGKNRAAATSAEFLAAASRAERDTLALSTLAGVAEDYFSVLALHERLAFARLDADAAQSLLVAVQARYDAGSASPVELAAEGSAVSAASLVIPSLQQAENEARGALALRVGRAPEDFAIEAQALDSLTEPVVAPGLPAELLTRRPDIVVAEANLQSAHADLAVARAAMFPNLALTAAGGVQNPALNAAVLTIPGTGPALTLAGSLTQVIFNHGRLQAQSSEVQARNEELLAAYRAAIVAALSDVENALAALRHLNDARAFQTEALAPKARDFATSSGRSISRPCWRRSAPCMPGAIGLFNTSSPACTPWWHFARRWEADGRNHPRSRHCQAPQIHELLPPMAMCPAAAVVRRSLRRGDCAQRLQQACDQRVRRDSGFRQGNHFRRHNRNRRPLRPAALRRE
jgi:NodT family efflux transporter outer membrane factor (OMF) lipoprotein